MPSPAALNYLHAYKRYLAQKLAKEPDVPPTLSAADATRLRAQARREMGL